MDNGKIKVNQEAVVVNHHDPDKLEKVRISKLYEFDGLNKVDVAEANIGFDCSNLRYRRYPHRRYNLLTGSTGGYSFPENFRAYNLYELHRKQQPSCRTGR